MSFSKEIKREIIEYGFENSCCELTFLSAYLRTCGSLEFRDGMAGFSLPCASAVQTRRFEDILWRIYSLSPLNKSIERGCENAVENGVEKSEVPSNVDKTPKIEKTTDRVEYLSPQSLKVLTDLNILSPEADGVSFELRIGAMNDCCKTAFVMGAFLGGGSCSVPDARSRGRSGYHLEFVFTYYETAQDFSVLLAERGIVAGLIERKNSFVVYIKNGAEIQDLLVIMNAPKSALKLSELIVYKEAFNSANRKKNCDLGNINKQIDAADKQCEAIDAIEQTIGLERLDEGLRAVCELRRSDSTLTMREMSEQLNISKSCLNHRLRKLCELAAQLKG